MKDSTDNDFRKEVYGRLEREEPWRWKQLRGCTVTHTVFGEGTITGVAMPDWSNPVHLSVTFGAREKTFPLSAFGDCTKFPVRGLPEPLATALEQAEQEIAGEKGRREEALQRKDHEAKETVLRRKEEADAHNEQRRQTEAREESARQEQAAARITAIADKVDQDLSLTVEETRHLREQRHHELLLRYYERAYARTKDYRAIVQACTAWRTAKQPDYALRVIGLLQDSMAQLSTSARAAVLTARGGVLLDLHNLVEAKECALGAIECDGQSPHPNNLLGAILIASGDTIEGARYFAKARQLASTHSVGRFEKAQQAEIQRRLQALDPASQSAFAQDLIRMDPQRYNWVQTQLR